MRAAGARVSHKSVSVTPPMTSPSLIEKQFPKATDEQEEKTAPRPKGESWLMFLRKYTNQTVPNLARKLSNINTEYLVLVSRHPNVVPMSTKTKIAEEVEKAWGVPIRVSLVYLSEEPKLLRAASTFTLKLCVWE